MCLLLKCTKLEVTRRQRQRRKPCAMSVNKEVVAEVELLALGSQLVLQWNLRTTTSFGDRHFCLCREVALLRREALYKHLRFDGHHAL